MAATMIRRAFFAGRIVDIGERPTITTGELA
jgi:hypothetical protein